MAAVTPLLRIQDLKTHFFADEGVVKAVDGATFEVFPGEVLGVVGESGCGKSVTARSVLRIVEKPGRIVGGRIDLVLRRDGREEAHELTALEEDGPEIRSIRGGAIAYVFQEPMTSFSPVHTIGNQISEMIRLHLGGSAEEARERSLGFLRMVGIPRPERALDTYAFQLSGGLRQRAMMAMALCCDPQLLIADEPTTALDVTTQAQVIELLRRLQHERSMAVMLITHNLGVIAEMASRVVVMYLGRVVEQGPVQAIFDSPRHPYTRALLASIPSIRSTPRVRLPTITGSIPHPFNRPRGCPFHPRCPHRIAGTCDEIDPPLFRFENGQEASCFLFQDGRR